MFKIIRWLEIFYICTTISKCISFKSKLSQLSYCIDLDTTHFARAETNATSSLICNVYEIHTFKSANSAKSCSE
uniref:Uncharacterized protein n=1 Tax=Arundo donax TaxID=35708 RepID=A0A0A8ZG49_ARUDO